ncbi:MAG: hypothetical protein QOF44_4829, partial [Streptomyces sp.]|nr:hypothetical protein [Streptomyces sp.]
MRRLAVLAVSVVLASSIVTPITGAATPVSGTVSPTTPSVAWEGPARTANTAGPSDAQCAAPAAPPLPAGFCDDFSLTVTVPSGYWATHAGGVQVDLTGVPPAEDFDLYVYDNTGKEVATSGLPGSVESALVPCADDAGSPYTVRAVY